MSYYYIPVAKRLKALIAVLCLYVVLHTPAHELHVTGLLCHTHEYSEYRREASHNYTEQR